MFPFVMLAIMPVFCNPSWPKEVIKEIVQLQSISKNHCKNPDLKIRKMKEKSAKKRIGIFIALYSLIQLILPFSHFITQVRIRININTPISIFVPRFFNGPYHFLILALISKFFFLQKGFQWLDEC